MAADVSVKINKRILCSVKARDADGNLAPMDLSQGLALSSSDESKIALAAVLSDGNPTAQFYVRGRGNTQTDELVNCNVGFDADLGEGMTQIDVPFTANCPTLQAVAGTISIEGQEEPDPEA